MKYILLVFRVPNLLWRGSFDVACLVVDTTAIAVVALNNTHFLRDASPTIRFQIQHLNNRMGYNVKSRV